jgi:hypothetical protein
MPGVWADVERAAGHAAVYLHTPLPEIVRTIRIVLARGSLRAAEEHRAHLRDHRGVDPSVVRRAPKARFPRPGTGARLMTLTSGAMGAADRPLPSLLDLLPRTACRVVS